MEPLRNLSWLQRGVLPLAVLLGGAVRASEPNGELAALRLEVENMNRRIHDLEAELQSFRVREVEVPPAQGSHVVFSDREVSLSSAENLHRLRLRGTVQADSRWYLDDGGKAVDGFVLRRARIIFEGHFNRLFQFQIIPEFGGSSPSLIAATLTAALSPAVQLRIGRFKQPVGLEHLQSDSDSLFVERSLATNLVAGMDVGAQISGQLLDGRLNYAAGIFNGAADATNGPNVDHDDGKAVAGRVMFRPGQRLTFGLGAAFRPGLEGAANLPSGYVSEGQQRIFSYRSDAGADGDAWRLAPQAFYFRGPIGVLAEYIQSATRVGTPAGSSRLRHEAGHLAFSYVLTGENASYTGVTPSRPFSLGGGWGALEMAVRASMLRFDDDSFPRFATGASVKEITSFAAGLNWNLTASLRAVVDYFHSDFERWEPTAGPSGERLVITRVQLVFED